MRCEELDDLFEALAEGEPESPGVRDHLAGCARCRERLALAREMERLLAVREVPAPSASFTYQVLRRVRQDRWRMEQVVDAGFNLAIAGGLLVVVGGLTGLLWSLGWFSIDVAVVAAAATTVAPWAADLASQMGTVMLAVALLSSALALWWWVEGGGEASL
jgi:predicted anti-sigma-YlaC factor YlaD